MYVAVSDDGKEEIRCWPSLRYFIEASLIAYTPTHLFLETSDLHCVYGFLDVIAEICMVAGKLTDTRRVFSSWNFCISARFLQPFGVCASMCIIGLAPASG